MEATVRGSRDLLRLAALVVTLVTSACASAGSVGGSTERLQIEKPATLIPGVGVAPIYPAALLGPNAAPGRVVIELTVRDDGTVDQSSMRVVEASDSAFVAPVLAALPTWRFLPHELGPQGGPFTKYEQRIRLPITVAVPPARRPR